MGYEDKTKEQLIKKLKDLNECQNTLIKYEIDYETRKQAEIDVLREKDKAHKYLDVAGVIILIIGSDQKVSLINKKGCLVLGYEEDEIIGKNWFDNFLPEKNREDVKTAFGKLMEGKLEPVECFENPVLTKSGEERIITWHNNYLKDEKGRITSTLSSGEDITDRKLAEEKQKQNEERYKKLLESVTDYIYSVKMENGSPVSTSHSPGCKTVTGYTSQEFQDDPYLWYKIIHEEDREAVIKQAEKVVSGSEFQPLEHRLITKNGSIRWVKNTPVKIYDQEGHLLAYDGLVADIDERKRAEKARRKSEERFRLLFENANDAIFVFRPSSEHEPGKFIEVNNLAYQRLGYSREEFLKLSPIDINPPEMKDKIPAFLKKLKEERHIIVETEQISKDGKRIPSEVSLHFFDFESHPAVLAVARDITERKRAESELKASENKFRTLFNNTNDSIFLVEITDEDMPGRLLEVNDIACNRYGYSREEFLKMSPLDLVAPEKLANTRKIMDEMIKNGYITFENIHVKKNGLRIPVEVSSHIFNFKGKRVILSIIRDITKRKKVEEKLKKAYEELKSLEILKTDIIANVSHELKTPITIIRGSIELALEEEDKKEIKKLLEKAENAINRQENTVNNLVAIGEMGLSQIYKAPHDIEELINRVIYEKYRFFEEKNIEVNINVNENIPFIPIDYEKIAHVLRNLMGNALKFNKKNGSITLEAKKVRNNLEVSVKDTGIGIKNEDIDKIFNPLTQLDASTKRRFSGTGTGLAVSKRFIEAHGGKIWVESKFGEGSTFYFSIPLSKEPEKQIMANRI